jgi:hypothetical protein
MYCGVTEVTIDNQTGFLDYANAVGFKLEINLKKLATS